MKEIIKLYEENLDLLPREVKIPEYARSEVKAGIVHIGIGGFHRSHEAFYMDQILQCHDAKDWGICGIALLDNDRKIYNTLRKQDGLYTLMITGSDGTLTARVIGSIIEYLFAPDDPDAAIEKIVNSEIKIITLTITEGGYNFDAATGEFLIAEPSIQRDLNNPDNPITVFGYITQALKRRREREIAGLTIQSCDNIQKNGDLLKKMMFSYVKEAEPGLIEWIDKHVTFPNSMVDRITPVTKQSDIENLKSVFGIEDEWPVVCEPYIQWVIEDNYSNGRPVWESVGVQFVKDVSPFEKMKIRLLNAGHSLLGFSGALYGYSYIHEVVHDKLFRELLLEFMNKEVTPILDEVPGIDLNVYKENLIERFGNPNIKDQVSRICLQSSAKIPKFLLPTIREQLHAGGPVKLSALVLALWCRYAEGIDESGKRYDLEDDMREILQEKALLSHQNNLAFLGIESIFGDLISSKTFTKTYIYSLNSIYRDGIAESVKNILKNIN